MRFAINIPTIVAIGVAIVVLLFVYHLCFHMRKE